jgi:hypothetical protein
MTTMIRFEPGDQVRVKGERGVYKVHRAATGKDGSLLLYGGDPNPNGVRGFRSVMPERLEKDTPKRAKKGAK